MRNVLLDKNSGSNKLLDACNKQGIVRCFLLPVLMRDTASDAEVAEFAIRKDDFIITFDKGFCLDAAAVLAGRSPGILLLRKDDESVEKITRKVATALLSKFKAEFPEWATVPWKNSMVELSPRYAVVHHMFEKEPVCLKRLDRKNDRDWQKMLKEYLESNAECAKQLPSSSPQSLPPQS
jgi:predicted nuclease of predicted toxin-antitoxin system